MKTKTEIPAYKLSILLICMLSAIFIIAQTASNIALPQDSGPKTIDVSKYPPEMQKAYKEFSEKCSKCHTLARPLNTSMTRDEWERYVKRMMHKPNSGISDKEGKQIFDFLIYDQTNRKDKNPKAFFRPLSDEELKRLQEENKK